MLSSSRGSKNSSLIVMANFDLLLDKMYPGPTTKGTIEATPIKSNYLIRPDFKLKNTIKLSTSREATLLKGQFFIVEGEPYKRRTTVPEICLHYTGYL
jgi:hypothetical protein